ncbi:MAG: endonuclease/exonuclease/phosphatase family protein, partial [Muribaculaceae bacterium]|nr:endonuclease/exonuclease/phosphatase family protein [Muribaculaceae bacterium]
ADSIAVIARAAGKPFVLMGDFNSRPESETIARFINNGFAIISDPAVPTFPSDSPDRTIDYIMIHRPGAGFSAGKPTVIPDSSTSDHRPIVVTVSGFCGKD